jgi:alkylation response protein AidB-like acyl-CoA dehydrogenase
VAAADEAGHWAPRPGGVRADYGTGGWRLSGRRWYVVSADAADIMLVPVVTESGLALFLAETRFPGLILARQLDLDLTRRISIVTFDSAPAELIAKDGAAALARAEREFLIAAAAEAAGGIGWCLDAALAYVRGRPSEATSGFEQAAQLCVDLVANMDSVSGAARHAAAASDIRASYAQAAAHKAALQAGESYRRAVDASLAFADEAEGLLHYRRAWSAERLSGGPQAHRAALAAQLAKPRPVTAGIS